MVTYFGRICVEPGREFYRLAKNGFETRIEEIHFFNKKTVIDRLVLNFLIAFYCVYGCLC